MWLANEVRNSGGEEKRGEMKEEEGIERVCV